MFPEGDEAPSPCVGIDTQQSDACQGFVWKLRYRGSDADLCACFGQELFEDAVKIEEARDLLKNLLWQMQTPPGEALIKQVLRDF